MYELSRLSEIMSSYILDIQLVYVRKGSFSNIDAEMASLKVNRPYVWLCNVKSTTFR